MQIIDNFGLASRSNRSFNPWLEKILNRVKESSNNDFILRLKGVRKTDYTEYSLNNSRNKTTAIIFKKGATIHVDTYVRNLPDPEREIKPDCSLVSSGDFPCDEQGITDAALAIYTVLNQENSYSLNEVTKIKVVPEAAIDNPWMFRGGRISDIEHADNQVRIIVENGKCTYALSNEQAQDKRISVRKYIIFNDKGEFQLVNSSEFEFYFEMKYERAH